MNRLIIIIIWIICHPMLISGQEASKTYRLLFDKQSDISNQIQSTLERLADNPNTKILGEKFHNIEYVTNLYRQNNFQPFWTEWDYAEDAISAILSSYEDGLIPLDYHLEAILVHKHQLTLNKSINDEKIARVAELDMLITDGIILYADHLLYGKIDPLTLIPTWNFGFSPIPDMNAGTFIQHIRHGDIRERLHQFRPQLFLYDTLIVTLARYRDIATNGGWPVVPTGGKIEPGESDSRIPVIRQRLKDTGYLTSVEDATSTLYDKELEADIRKFQGKYILEPDGVIGAGTFREMNVPVEKRIETLRINLERIRWIARNLPESYLIVNIASFWMMLIKDGEIILRERVVVGRPLNTTPVFREKMRYIEFNPTWTIPSSIIKNEIIPKWKKDPEYLQKNQMVLLDSKGNIIPESDIDLKNLSPSRFPFMIRQQPGPWNALGEVKFMFPNKYDIYLHDTPSKSLFLRASRAYSHGCIRVDKPLEFAEIIQRGTDWDHQKINKVIQTKEITRVNLNQPLDVLITYWTCGLNQDREIFFASDIYDRDKEVLKELDRLLR